MRVRVIKETVETWQKFEEVVDGLAVHKVPGRYSFRGQAQEKWTLTPSLARLLPKETEHPIARLIEKRATEQFYAHMHRYFGPNEMYLAEVQLPPDADKVAQDNEYAWTEVRRWTLMQTYGGSTRLLDWSLSPHVGLYFAVNQHLDKPGALWYFDLLGFKGAITTAHPAEHDMRHLIEHAGEPAPQGGSPRMHHCYYLTKSVDRMFRQQGIFTLCHDILLDHDRALCRLQEHTGKPIDLHKLIIPEKLKQEFLRRLRTMNITGASLFTGIQGLISYVKEITLGLTPPTEETAGGGQ